VLLTDYTSGKRSLRAYIYGLIDFCFFSLSLTTCKLFFAYSNCLSFVCLLPCSPPLLWPGSWHGLRHWSLVGRSSHECTCVPVSLSLSQRGVHSRHHPPRPRVYDVYVDSTSQTKRCQNGCHAAGIFCQKSSPRVRLCIYSFRHSVICR